MRNFVRRVSHPFNYLLNEVCFSKTVARHSTVATSQMHGDLGTLGQEHHKSRHLHTTPRWCLPRNVYNAYNREAYDEVLKRSVHVIVDIYAKWCLPSDLLIPRLEQLVEKMNGAVILSMVNIDVHEDLANSLHVTALPTVIGMKNGREVNRFIGLKDDSTLEEFVKKLLEAPKDDV